MAEPTRLQLAQYAASAAKKTTLPDIALGAWEAACVAGVHPSRIKRMAEVGHVIYRPMGSAWSRGEDRRNEYLLYSLHDCDENYRDYVTEFVERGGRMPYRPRSDEWLSKHDDMMRRLANVEPIHYDDAISTAQASAILGVHITWVNAMIREDKIKARVAINDRRSGGRVYIVSRRSCEQNRAAASAAERAGTKPGSPRWEPTETIVPAVKPRGRRKAVKKVAKKKKLDG